MARNLTQKLISWVLLVAVVAGVYLYVRNNYYSPCDTVIPYKIGSVDTRFAISQDKLKSDIVLATGIWEKAEGHPLFEFDDKAILTVNLVYDERQALNTQIQNQEGALKGDQNTLANQIAQYKSQVADFNKRVADLNKQISDWNSKGGAPQTEYDKLLSEQKSLQEEANRLNALAKTLNQQTANYNSSVVKLNGTINTFNNDLATKPEEGIYDSDKNTIDIFFMTNKNELVHTLAHEFGHALGFNHTDDTKAIMYAQASSTVTAADSDIRELKRVCERKSLLDIFTGKIQSFLNVERR